MILSNFKKPVNYLAPSEKSFLSLKNEEST